MKFTIKVFVLFASLFVLSSTTLDTECLAAHNPYRKEVSVPDLIWSEVLAASAQTYADHIAELEIFAHSKQAGVGENLSRGTLGFYTPTKLIQSWGAEKKYFMNEIFPNVSTSGTWQDVGHYTQIIWKDTQEVGCGTAASEKHLYLVCHYSPPGNFKGRFPLGEPMTQPEVELEKPEESGGPPGSSKPSRFRLLCLKRRRRSS